MKKFKKVILFFALLFSYSFIFAAENVRLNSIIGSCFKFKEDTGDFYFENGLIANYEFKLTDSSDMAVGAEACLLISPYVGMNVSYIKCLMPKSEWKYRFYIEAELHGGIRFYNSYYMNPDGDLLTNKHKFPVITTDVLLTFKPTTWGFYGGLGPSWSFTYCLSNANKKKEYIVFPGFFVTIGVRID